MKVCTDACLFGAWVADKLEAGEIRPHQILDIGSGTGLLSLMLAQKTTAQINAVEIDEEAFLQSKENIHASPWDKRVFVHHSSVAELPHTKKYDLIICNPPFYENQLSSPDTKRNAAMHSSTLTLKELAVTIRNLLNPHGHAAVLLPFDRHSEWETLLQDLGLSLSETIHIAHSPKHKPFRSFMLSSFSTKTGLRKEIIIKDNTAEYSAESFRLLKDYYTGF
ncbi:MAG: methyltransferase [Ferruginibacter sp.]